MSFHSNIMDSLVASSFKQDATGATIFYPLGIWGRGRVLPNAEVAGRLRKTLRTTNLIIFSTAMLLAAVVATSFHRMTWGGLLLIVALTLVSGLVVNSWLFSLVRGYPTTDEPLTLREGSRAQAKAMGRNGVLVSLLCSVMFAAASMIIALADWGTGSRVMALMGIVFFGACAILNWLNLRELDTDAAVRTN